MTRQDLAPIALMLTIAALVAPRPAAASTYEDRIRTAPVTSAYSQALYAYTGGSYSIGTVNQLWPRFPRGQVTQRAAMLKAARDHGLPLRLLMGVYGMESGFGRFRCYFGLTGYFPRTGTSGSFSRDAALSAGIFRRLLGRRMIR
jgi:membrane-bound lytic murein transglycosylase B